MNMTPLALKLLLPVMLLGVNSEDYSQARKTTTESGRPMVVMVGAQWCPACVQMKDNSLPQVRERGLLRKVVFAMVDFDREKALASELTNGGPIPQLLMYRKTQDGWRLRRLVGGQDPTTIENFINEGIELDQASKQATKKEAGDKTAPKSENVAPPKAKVASESVAKKR
jgi:thiol-disulfide isomerase/thioredoxin